MTPDFKLNFKLKLKSRRLQSGNMQINFSIEGFAKECYGYLLAEPNTPVREVIEKIGRHAGAMQNADRYHQRNLFSLRKREINSGKILIFNR
jgi:hypothetical protein